MYTFHQPPHANNCYLESSNGTSLYVYGFTPSQFLLAEEWLKNGKLCSIVHVFFIISEEICIDLELIDAILP